MSHRKSIHALTPQQEAFLEEIRKSPDVVIEIDPSPSERVAWAHGAVPVVEPLPRWSGELPGLDLVRVGQQLPALYPLDLDQALAWNDEGTTEALGGVSGFRESVRHYAREAARREGRDLLVTGPGVVLEWVPLLPDNDAAWPRGYSRSQCPGRARA